jgi:hypothetical protein
VPGALHLTMDPPYAGLVRLDYVLGDGTRIPGDVTENGIDVIVNRSFQAGSIHVLYNEVLCDGAIEIVSAMESDVVLDLGGDDPGCRLVRPEIHPLGSVRHPELPLTARVSAELPFGVPSTFVLMSLDTPGASPVARVDVNKAPWEVNQIEVDPGGYELSVLVDGVRLGSLREHIPRGSDWVFSLRILPPYVPRDCGDIAADPCERAITTAYGRGLFLQGDTRVSSVAVRATRYMSCDSLVDPEFDVTFQLVRPKGEIEVTVGTQPNGRLTACTY